MDEKQNFWRETEVGFEYSLRFDPEPSGRAGDLFTLPLTVRMPKKLYAKHVRLAGKHPVSTETEALFFMAAALSGLKPEELERLDVRDYSAVVEKVQEIVQATNF